MMNIILAFKKASDFDLENQSPHKTVILKIKISLLEDGDLENQDRIMIFEEQDHVVPICICLEVISYQWNQRSSHKFTLLP